MGKNKLKRFAENETFSNLFQPPLEEVLNDKFELKGKWGNSYFKNINPLVLELGCGKGEYTVSLAGMNPQKNFIGIDIKGARIWRGAKNALENKLNNVAFVRTRIEHICSIFAQNEVDELWITFPDPQEREIKAKKRLTSSRFLNLYSGFLKPNAIVHLKTDNRQLFDYTKALVEQNKFNVLICTTDLYANFTNDPVLGIKTFYEQQFLGEGLPITYLRFVLNHPGPYHEPIR